MLLLTSQVVHAGVREDRILNALRKAHPSTNFTSVVPTPLKGIYAVQMGENLAYVTATDSRHMIFGHLFDTATMRDLAPQKRAPAVLSSTGAVTSADISDLPSRDAIRTVHGTGARRLVIFTDPGCGYCRQLQAELDHLENVTILNFMVPFFGAGLPATIWCAEDREAAWKAAVSGKLTAASATCDTPLARNEALARRLGVSATPTLFLEGGRRIEGVLTAAELQTLIHEETPRSGGGK
ncbi:DsbC family protein [Zemynaea arenosa]|uniref:DsbC family protein n=1 Tax=Zemynaea arenosa TaxID=2561931 RepID=UPI0014314572|nr:DsbC family protein [Massilia arenosa]